MIETLHTKIYDLVNAITTFNGGYYEKPKELTDEKVPTFAVYYNGHSNSVSSSNTNKRTHEFIVDVMYDKETLSVTQTVLAGLIDSVIDTLESRTNLTLSGNACYTEPTSCERVEDYEIAGKHYMGYRIYLPVVVNKQL